MKSASIQNVVVNEEDSLLDVSHAGHHTIFMVPSNSVNMLPGKGFMMQSSYIVSLLFVVELF